MSADPGDVQRVLDEMRMLVSADGADLELASETSAPIMELRLVLDQVSCLDCVLPPDLLNQMVTDHVRRALPDGPPVRLIDPRVTAG